VANSVPSSALQELQSEQQVTRWALERVARPMDRPWYLDSVEPMRAAAVRQDQALRVRVAMHQAWSTVESEQVAAQHLAQRRPERLCLAQSHSALPVLQNSELILVWASSAAA
jgi:cation transport regulator ChaB